MIGLKQINLLQSKVRLNSSAHSGLESFKVELKSRDDMIERLREEILILQEKRDAASAEVITWFFFSSSSI
jgi:hypothetical protein